MLGFISRSRCKRRPIHVTFCSFHLHVFGETSETKRFADWRNNETLKRFARTKHFVTHILYGPLSSLRSSASSAALRHPSAFSTALCPFYGPLPFLRPSALFLRPSALFLRPSALFLRPSALFLRPSALSTALYPSTAIYLSSALYPLFGPLPSLRPSTLSSALYPLFGPLPSLRPSTLSSALYPLFGPLSPLRPSCIYLSLPRPSFPSTALCPL
jgi:hypothetical protein